jgi:hypothetical protein
MLIAVDFDGTIVEHAFPEIGKPQPGAFETMRALQAAGHKLILNTCREDTKVFSGSRFAARHFLTEAVNFCRKNGIEFHSVNVNAKGDDSFRDGALHRRKIYAKVYIDDRNLGGFPGWDVVATTLGVRVQYAT